MIHEYVKKLVDNLPENIKNKPIKIDLILDGGVFNGSYLIGALYFLKEMEKRKYIKIQRISGCSIGSIASFLYYIDCLDLFQQIYTNVFHDFKKNYHLKNIMYLQSYLESYIPENICERVNKKMYVTYYNIQKKKKIVKNTYKNKEEIIRTLIKSCYVPFLIDGNLLHKEKYMDGINPYIFKKTINHEKQERKILYLDLFGYDKLTHLLNIKNEKTNFHRILSGLLDIHNFYIKQSHTQMCSYVDQWSLLHSFHHFLKQIIEQICLYSVYTYLYIQKHLPCDVPNHLIYRIITKVVYEIYVCLLENYCF